MNLGKHEQEVYETRTGSLGNMNRKFTRHEAWETLSGSFDDKNRKLGKHEQEVQGS